MNLFDIVADMARTDAALARAGVTPERRAELLTIGLPDIDTDEIPGLRVDLCPICNGNVLVDVERRRARCTNADCTFTGHVLRRLP